MTAHEAFELKNGSMKHKGIWFKARLAWLCGIINRRIENAAESGCGEIKLHFANESTRKQYLPLIWSIYEDLGYTVYYKNNYDHAYVHISWEPDINTDTFYDINHASMKKNHYTECETINELLQKYQEDIASSGDMRWKREITRDYRERYREIQEKEINEKLGDFWVKNK